MGIAGSGVRATVPSTTVAVPAIAGGDFEGEVLPEADDGPPAFGGGDGGAYLLTFVVPPSHA